MEAVQLSSINDKDLLETQHELRIILLQWNRNESLYEFEKLEEIIEKYTEEINNRCLSELPLTSNDIKITNL